MKSFIAGAMIVFAVIASESLASAWSNIHRVFSILQEDGQSFERDAFADAEADKSGRIFKWSDPSTHIVSSKGFCRGEETEGTMRMDPGVEGVPDFSVSTRFISSEEQKHFGTNFKKCEYEIKGYFSHEAFGGLGASGCVMEGRGIEILDVPTGNPVAGWIHLERRLVPELWRADAGDDELVADLWSAWAALP